MLLKICVCRPDIGLKHFDKLKPEPGPTYNSGLNSSLTQSAGELWPEMLWVASVGLKGYVFMARLLFDTLLIVCQGMSG